MAEQPAVPPDPVPADVASGAPSNPDQLSMPANDSSFLQCGPSVFISLIICLVIVGLAVIFAVTEEEDITGTRKPVTPSSKCQPDPDEVGRNEETFFPEKEEPPLICSLNGSRVVPHVEQLCSHLVFLEATVDRANKKASPASGTTKGFQMFKRMKRHKGAIKKLISFPVHAIRSMPADDIDESFASIRGGWLDGVDIRYMDGKKSFRALFQELRVLADKKKYIIHGVFDKVNIRDMKHFHVASLRAYLQTSLFPINALGLQEEEEIERQAKEYATAVASANLASFGNHCIAFTIAGLKYKAVISGDFAANTEKLNYCSKQYNRSCADLLYQGRLTQYQRIGTAIFAYDTPRGFQVKINNTRFLPNACITLDDVSYDYHKCECTVKNFRLLRVAREFLWRGHNQ